jgi:hypothetical protein
MTNFRRRVLMTILLPCKPTKACSWKWMSIARMVHSKLTRRLWAFGAKEK